MVLRRFMRAGADVPELAATRVAADMRHNAIQVVDVREDHEWRAGHIDGAVHIPLGSLGSRAAALDPARPVVTVCRSGQRSLVAAQALKRAGFSDVANMQGGMLGWTRAGLAVKR